MKRAGKVMRGVVTSDEMFFFALLNFMFFCFTHGANAAPNPCVPFRADLTREAHFIYGINAPVPMFAAQIEQESGCRPDITAWDKGRGLAQFMDGTSAQISKIYPELGSPNPYNPLWSIRALVRYDGWILQRVKGENDCEKWGAGLHGYNAGLGFSQRQQNKSPDPLIWFMKTEYLNAGQSAKNFEYSREYPRWILFKRQKNYLLWGAPTCLPAYNPPDKPTM